MDYWAKQESFEDQDKNYGLQKGSNKVNVMSKRNSGSTNTKNKSDIYDALKPIYVPSKICGLLPVKFTKDDSGKYKGQVDPFQVAYGIFVLSLLIGGQLFGLYRDLRNGWQNSTRLNSQTAITVTCSDVGAVVCVVVAAILSAPHCWRHLEQALNNMIEIDEKLGIPTSLNLRRSSIILIVSSFVALTILNVMDFISWSLAADAKQTDTTSEKGAINYSAIYLMYYVIETFELQYALIIVNVGERLLKINKSIEDLTKNNIVCEYFKKDMGLKSKSVTDSIDTLMVLHGVLCDSINLINKAFGAPVLFATISCLLHLIITAYFLYMTDSTRTWFVTLLQVMWIIFHSYRLFLVVQPCYMVSTKSENTGAIVSHALASQWNSQVKKELEIFSLQLIHRPIKFDVCGLFSIDRELITSIVGTVTTYLVILVQFQTADDTTKSTSELFRNVTLLKNATYSQNFNMMNNNQNNNNNNNNNNNAS